MYHYVRDLNNSNYPKIKGLDIKEFENQLIFLSKNYNVISIEDFYNKNFNINKKTCVLTFDDGYVDHYDFVLDKLLKYKMKGAIAIIRNTGKTFPVYPKNREYSHSIENKIYELDCN